MKFSSFIVFFLVAALMPSAAFAQSELKLSPRSISFPSQGTETTSTPRDVLVENKGRSTLTVNSVSITGIDSADFSQDNNCGSPLDPGTSCRVSILFTPLVAGKKVAVFSVNSSVGQASVSLKGTGAPPKLATSPSRLTFGKQAVDTSSESKQIAVRNSGKGLLSLSSIQLTGEHAAQFSLRNECSAGPLQQGDRCTVSVRYSPTTGGAHNASLEIISNAGEKIVSLAGTGLAPIAKYKLSPKSLSFGRIGTGTSSERTLTIKSTGTGPFQVLQVRRTGEDADAFSQINNCGLALSPGESCEIRIRFSPNSMGNKEATFELDTNAGDIQVVLKGSGLGPKIKVSPSTLRFSSMPVGETSTTVSATVSNTGAGLLLTPTVSLTGDHPNDFLVDNACFTNLPRGDSCSLNVTFAPKDAGTRAATLEVSSADVVARIALRGDAEGIILRASAVGGGSIRPTRLQVVPGASATFFLTPDTGFKIDEISGCDGTLEGLRYTTNPVESACTVTARFTQEVTTGEFDRTKWDESVWD